MGLTIARFAIECRAPRNRRDAAAVVDRVVRERFASELAAFLGPNLARTPEIVRIRRLRLRIRTSAAGLTEQALLQALLEAFGRALFAALAYPEGAGPYEMQRADSRAHYLARYFRDAIEGKADAAWRYPEFATPGRSWLDAGVAGLLLAENPVDAAAVLALLSQSGTLDRVVEGIDDLGAERLFAHLAANHGAPADVMNLQLVTHVCRMAAASGRIAASPLAARRQALLLFARAWRDREPIAARPIFHALRIIVFLLENPDVLLAPGPHALELRQSFLRLPPAAREFLSGLVEPPLAPAESVALAESLHLVRPLLPSALPASVQAPPEWIESEWAGLLLLTGPALRVLGRFEPMRDLHILLASIAAGIAGVDYRRHDLLPAAGLLFAGIMGEPDSAGSRAWFETVPPSQRERLLDVFPLDRAFAADWPLALEAAGTELIRRFAAQIRGFRQASRPAIAAMFLNTAGRIRVEEKRIFVALAPSPYHVALNIAGAAHPVEAVPWLGGRNLEFHLEGL
jgi:hypothetical protein